MPSSAPPRALVTGASSGIGEQLARRLSREGYELVLVARRAAELARVAGSLSGPSTAIPADLTDRGAPAAIAEALGPRGVDVLVNNAGGGWVGPFAEAPLGRQLEIVDLNVRALVELTHRLLPPMLARRSGRIAQIASVAGFLPGPLASVYYASKAFVVRHAQALRHELRESGVSVTLSCPGPVDTDFQRASGVRASTQAGELGRRVGTSAAEVADATVDALFGGRFLVVPGAANQALVGLSRWVPDEVLVRVMERLQRARMDG